MQKYFGKLPVIDYKKEVLAKNLHHNRVYKMSKDDFSQFINNKDTFAWFDMITVKYDWYEEKFYVRL